MERTYSIPRLVTVMSGSKMRNISINDYKHLVDLERQWIGQIPRNKENWDWQPYPLESFIDMAKVVADAFPAGVVPTFLDPGCGIGTKVFVAKELFGWEACGFDIVPEYINAGHEKLDLNSHVALGDVDMFRHYDIFDIVYLSRPFRDDKREYAYECKVQEAMKPGAFLISGWAGAKPHWKLYYRGPWKGVWRKPYVGEVIEPLPLAPIPRSSSKLEPNGRILHDEDCRPPTGGQWEYEPGT
jgi:SAM-dependent methyltransferase